MYTVIGFGCFKWGCVCVLGVFVNNVEVSVYWVCILIARECAYTLIAGVGVC